ncbi:aldo/keto reductase [Halorubrum sp. DTA46]|uniref:aldo/keto reductase n=1 Tax=Halorubrum sp. DTA46 TaxID=3402162 RepID=UPI003AAA9382
MEYVSLGQTGLKVSQLCFGTWRFGRESSGVIETGREEAHELLDAAHGEGINFIDTADLYGDVNGTAERYLGEWIAERDRDDFVIASKVCYPFNGRGEPGPNDRGLGRKHIRRQIEGTLDRLGTDYLDLYYIHRWDETTPITETLRTLDTLVREGRVHHLGASTMAAWQLMKALGESARYGLERFEVAQPPFDATYNNMKRYEGFDLDPYLDVCADQALAVCPYSPLAGGFLTGKYDREGNWPAGSRGVIASDDFSRKYVSDVAWEVHDAVVAVADELDVPPAQVALRWLIQQERFETVVPIIGARTPAQLAENAGVSDVRLDSDQLARIAAPREATSE